jgi:hypothetical protein
MFIDILPTGKPKITQLFKFLVVTVLNDFPVLKATRNRASSKTIGKMLPTIFQSATMPNCSAFLSKQPETKCLPTPTKALKAREQLEENDGPIDNQSIHPSNNDKNESQQPNTAAPQMPKLLPPDHQGRFPPSA